VGKLDTGISERFQLSANNKKEIDSQFTYTDLFAGVGGFAAALNALGGRHVLSAEIDVEAARTYLANFNTEPQGDVRELASESGVKKVSTDVVAAGFPCQPFSKSGAQKGTLDKVRGTLFENIIHFVSKNKPTVIILENVRNLIGPKHFSDYQEIIAQLRGLGYKVSDYPSVISPHLISREFGGRPQSRPRVYITATYNPSANNLNSWERPEPPVSPASLAKLFESVSWNVGADLPLDKKNKKANTLISPEEIAWIEVWQSFVERNLKFNDGFKLPGFPLWSDVWFNRNSAEFSGDLPDWKAEIIRKNEDFYAKNRKWINQWVKENSSFANFPSSRRKLEWQAGSSSSIWENAIQLRPSGIRVKKLNYLPALVAMNQSSIIGPLKRRVTVRESARLQGFPDGYVLTEVSDKAGYKQMGNAIHVGSAYFILREHVKRDREILKNTTAGQRILSSVSLAPNNPDEVFKTWGDKVIPSE
jgi:DNA (cytosine-5)-methyltransferase 1